VGDRGWERAEVWENLGLLTSVEAGNSWY
jgi:hypothetical protein